MTNYNKYYLTENLFGKPYPELIQFFTQFEPKGSLLDLGCGQGRDSIPLARLGYRVTGIDSSKVGIEQMMAKARSEGLDVTGITSDIYTFDNYRDYDIVLLNSMFHFYKRDKQRETGLITKIVNQIHSNALICICIQDTGTKVRIMKETIKNCGVDFDILNDSSLMYNYEDKESGNTSKTKYGMYIVRKK